MPDVQQALKKLVWNDTAPTRYGRSILMLASAYGLGHGASMGPVWGPRVQTASTIGMGLSLLFGAGDKNPPAAQPPKA